LSNQIVKETSPRKQLCMHAFLRWKWSTSWRC